MMNRRTRKRVKLSNSTIEKEPATSENLNNSMVPRLLSIPNIDIDTKWLHNGETVAGTICPGVALHQLNYPWDLDVDDDQNLYVAEYSNQRITKWTPGARQGEIVAGGNKIGSRTDQLNGPANVIIDKFNDAIIISEHGNRRVVRWPLRNGKHGETIISNIDCWGLAMDRDGYLYISDYKKHEVRRWRSGDISETVVAGGNGKGNRLDQLHFPAHLCVDQDFTLYISDIGNHRLMKWILGAKEGIIIAGNQGIGMNLSQLSYPSGIAIDQSGTIYVVDSLNHRIMRWFKEAKQGCLIVGEHGQGAELNQLNGPVGLSIDRQGNIYVADNLNHRIQKFCIDST